MLTNVIKKLPTTSLRLVSTPKCFRDCFPYCQIALKISVKNKMHLKHFPGLVLPARPARCCALAFEIADTSKDSTRILGLYT